MKRDTCLLKFENSKEEGSNERVLHKFLLKPGIGDFNAGKGKEYLNNLKSFVENFKKSNDELLNDENLLKEKNIEDANYCDKSKDNEYIEMNLGLGILEQKEKIDNHDSIINNVIKTKSENKDTDFVSPYFDNEIDKEILRFITSNKQRRRIHFIKHKNKNK